MSQQGDSIYRRLYNILGFPNVLHLSRAKKRIYFTFVLSAIKDNKTFTSIIDGYHHRCFKIVGCRNSCSRIGRMRAVMASKGPSDTMTVIYKITTSSVSTKEQTLEACGRFIEATDMDWMGISHDSPTRTTIKKRVDDYIFARVRPMYNINLPCSLIYPCKEANGIFNQLARALDNEKIRDFTGFGCECTTCKRFDIRDPFAEMFRQWRL